MRLVYFIQAHHQPLALQWLIDALYNPADLFAIRIDAKTAYGTFDQSLRSIRDRGNVIFLDPMSVTWGGWSQCVSQFAALQSLCADDLNWDYFINLSGQDFPLKSRAELEAFLSRHRRQNFIEIQKIEHTRPPFRNVVKRRSRWLSAEISGKSRRFPIWLGPGVASKYRYVGSSWFMLSREFCEWIVASGQPHVRFLRLTRSPDEAWVQHLIMSSPFADTLVADNKRFYIWDGKPNPKILTIRDLDRVLSSSAFFARKIDETKSQSLVDHLRSELQREPKMLANGIG